MAYSISVIIPTRGRDACLRQTLRDLAEQSYSEFDVWVVDQNDTPLKDLYAEIPNKKFIHECIPPVGSHGGRNHAIFKTKSELCVFVDDDVRLKPDFLKSHAEAYDELGSIEVGAIAGRVIQPKDGYTDEQMLKMGQPARYNRWLGTVSGNFVGPQEAFVEHIHECNFSARTSALQKIGGFNEEFKGNAYFEGADLALRMIHAGYKIDYRPEIVLVHLQDAGGGNRVNDKARHTYWYMRNYGLLNSLHMNRLGLPLFGAYSLTYILGKAVKNADPEIARQGLHGLLDGLKYFIPGTPRIKRHV